MRALAARLVGSRPQDGVFVLLLVTIGLVVIAAVALVIGFVSSTVAWIYVSIACSAVAGLVLYLFSRMSRRRVAPLGAAPSGAVDEAAMAGAGMSPVMAGPAPMEAVTIIEETPAASETDVEP